MQTKIKKKTSEQTILQLNVYRTLFSLRVQNTEGFFHSLSYIKKIRKSFAHVSIRKCIVRVSFANKYKTPG